MNVSARSWQIRSPWITVGLGAIVVFILLMLVAQSLLIQGHGALGPSSPAPAQRTGTLVATANAGTSTAAFSLSISAAPGAICAYGQNGCPAGTGEARVQLAATAGGAPQPYWPNVQVVFVVETTAYDGIWGYVDPTYGLDPCAPRANWAPLCEESNGVPFFVAHAQQIANGIQSSNPHSQVSFAMVDYYDAWGSGWDDQDGPEYNVDIGNFIPATQFGSAVASTFQQTNLAGSWYNWDQDLDNNFLDASQITALYGAIIGSQLNWTNGAHHVIVWMGSTAPRDPGYSENYCVSPSVWNVWGRPASCFNQSCEPSYAFPSGGSPPCEGWIRSQDGNPLDSIAALARSAPACVHSVGGECTVDTIDLPTTPTDAYSPAWPSQFANIGGGPGGPQVVADVNHIIAAGCDLAAATGGSWDGPSWTSCPNGEAGTLQLLPHGPVNNPNLNNPQLYQALRSISFGPVYKTEFARGTNEPLFTFVPFGSIAVAPDPQWTVACTTPSGVPHNCPRTPTIVQRGGVDEYGWNWSSNQSANAVYDGDVWVASFFVQATGPPFTTVPIDACTTTLCHVAGSGSVGGLYTRATYIPPSNTSVVSESFPVATVLVQIPATVSAVTAPPPPPPLPVPPAIPATLPIPAIQVVPVTSQVGIGNVSAQGIAAGLLAAGFIRVSMKNRPIALRVAAKAGAQPSKFDKESAAQSRSSGVGRFD